MGDVTLATVLLMVGIPFFGVYPAYLFRKGRLSLESLIVYLAFMVWVVMLAFGTILNSGPLVIGSFAVMLLTVGLAIVFRKEMLRDAYSVEVSPDEPLRLRWLVALNSSFWVWLAYRRGATLAAFLNVLTTYLTVLGTIALLNHFLGGHFPLKSFATLYAVVSVFQFRDAYGRLYEKTGID
ncbi:hypothetical protein E3E38_00325 [Thermococcus sp. 18S1]|uniref:hypothetical protein n=1 Tax=Thermococcus sp. 18S1 TaxID=1638210 RepID=UPI001439AA1A|nr:hypothetical protein [Thermococcus sp. 18S1]NJE29501.1 hypothetical protein [Thermococcus sp. 18S1]